MKRFHYIFNVRTWVEVDADDFDEAVQKASTMLIEAGQGDLELESEEPNESTRHEV